MLRKPVWETLHALLQAEGKWGAGPEEGGLARAHAARALAELSAEPGLHKLLDRSGAVSVLAHHTAELVGPFTPGGAAPDALGKLPSYMGCLRQSLEMKCALMQAALNKEQPETKTYSSLSELPGNMVERHSVEDERFSAAAVFGLSSSDEGIQAMLRAGPDLIPCTPI